MGQNSLQQIVGPAVMEKKEPLSNTPQRSRAEHIALCEALCDVIGQSWPHMMQEEIRIEIHGLVLQSRYFSGRGSLHGWRVTQGNSRCLDG